MGKKTTEVAVSAVHEQENESFVIGSFFNGLHIPEKSAFDLYKHKAKDTYFLHGENDALEYNGYTDDDTQNEYVVAVYDAKQKSVELFKAPVISGSVTSLENRVHKGPKIKLRGEKNMNQRIALGRAFGTKKAKAAILNTERNRIEAERLLHMEMDIVDDVKTYTQDLPSLELLQSSDGVERPTPFCDEAATKVEDIYPLERIVSARDLGLVRVGPLLEEEDAEKRAEYLPFSTAYLNKAVSRFVALGNTKKLQMVYYVSLMLAVYKNPYARSKTDLMEKLDNKPAEALVDGILDRFAVARALNMGKSKDRSFVIDPFHEDKLLCYALALLFHIEGYALEISPLAAALNMKTTRLQSLLRALGAVIKPVGVAQAEALGISKREAQTYKLAHLKVPFKLPDAIKRGKRR